MDIKLICDRCKHDIVNNEKTLLIKFGFTSPQELSYYDLNLPRELTEYMCLCDKCQGDFRRFMQYEKPIEKIN